jgi:hypothetical protein
MIEHCWFERMAHKTSINFVWQCLTVSKNGELEVSKLKDRGVKSECPRNRHVLDCQCKVQVSLQQYKDNTQYMFSSFTWVNQDHQHKTNIIQYCGSMSKHLLLGRQEHKPALNMKARDELKLMQRKRVGCATVPSASSWTPPRWRCASCWGWPGAPHATLENEMNRPSATALVSQSSLFFFFGGGVWVGGLTKIAQR